MFKLAWEGFKRYRKRRKNLSFVLICSCMMLLFFWSLFSQMNANIRSFWVERFVGGDVIVSAETEYYDFYTALSLNKTFSFSALKDQHGKGRTILAPRLRTGALFEQTQEVPLVVIGVVPALEQRLGEHIVVEEGRWCAAGELEVMLAGSTARTIGVELGDKVIFTVLTADGLPSYELLTVSGFVAFSNVSSILGTSLAYMPLDTLQQLTQLDADQVNEVLVGQAPFIRYRLGDEYTFVAGSATLSFARLMSTAVALISVLLLIVLGSFLFQTISHNIVIMMDERSREIGVYLTFGGSPAWIRKIMALELLFYTAYCVLLGCLLGSLLVWGVNSLGLYAFDIATEILLSTSHFVIRVGFGAYALCFGLIALLVALASSVSVVKSTARKSIRTMSLS